MTLYLSWCQVSPACGMMAVHSRPDPAVLGWLVDFTLGGMGTSARSEPAGPALGLYHRVWASLDQWQLTVPKHLQVPIGSKPHMDSMSAALYHRCGTYLFSSGATLDMSPIRSTSSLLSSGLLARQSLPAAGLGASSLVMMLSTAVWDSAHTRMGWEPRTPACRWASITLKAWTMVCVCRQRAEPHATHGMQGKSSQDRQLWIEAKIHLRG